MDLQLKIDESVNIALDFGWVEGSHHRMWVIDQMIRVLLGYKYEDAIAHFQSGEDGPDTYEWDTGIAP